MKKCFVAMALAALTWACGVPTGPDTPSTTTSRGDALETGTLPAVHLDIGEPLVITVDLTDPRVIERASRPLVEDSFFYDVFGRGGGCSCHCGR